MLATERLKINPGDVEAISILVDVEQKVGWGGEGRGGEGRGGEERRGDES